MAGKSKKNSRREVVRLFEKSLDRDKLNYKKLTQPTKPKSMLFGLGIAFGVYGIGFATAYAALNNNILPIDGFAKLVWIMMLPTTMFGLVGWQLSKNRMEQPIRQEILEYITEIEEKGGLIWKFAPLMEMLPVEDIPTKKAIDKSREGKIDELALEDYTDAVACLYKVLSDFDNRTFPTSVAESVLENFGKLEFAS